jgi:hypothetical protein
VKSVNPFIEAAIIQLTQGILKRGVKKMHATLLLPEYEHLGPYHPQQKVRTSALQKEFTFSYPYRSEFVSLLLSEVKMGRTTQRQRSRQTRSKAV